MIFAIGLAPGALTRRGAERGDYLLTEPVEERLEESDVQVSAGRSHLYFFATAQLGVAKFTRNSNEDSRNLPTSNTGEAPDRKSPRTARQMALYAVGGFSN